MKKIKSYKKILIPIILIILIIGIVPIKSNAVVPIDTAYVYANRKTDALLKCEGMNIHTHLAMYQNDGKEYPAYCLNRDLYGVEIGFSQNLTVNSLLNNVSIWRVIINGYPYKTIEELGCETEEEAYLATKQAIYSTIVGRDINTAYTSIGESGERVLNAIKQIINNAQNSSEVKVSSELTINQLNSLWQIDKIDSKYISQEFSISAKAPMDSYKVELSDINLEGIKIVDENNNEKNEFNYAEKFKVIIPINNIIDDGTFNINVFGRVNTKPVFYGESNDPTLQNFALTGFSYEDGTGSKKIYYTKNETKIIIAKKDETGENELKGVEFDLLDSNKNVLFTGLTTDENGKIEINNLLPGKYFVQETKTLEGYDLYDKLIEVDLDLNEITTVNVINTKKEVQIEVKKPISEITVNQEKSEIINEVQITKEVEIVKPTEKLPKTGM